MPASQPAHFNLQEFTDVGQLMVGGRLYTYAYGTTAQKTAFTDPDGTVPHTYTLDGAGGQYIALNARGELPAPLYLGTGSYDISLKRADGSTVWTRKADGVENSNRSLVAQLAAWVGTTLIGHLDAGANAVATTIAEIFSRRVSVWDFMTPAQRADALSGNPQLDHAPAFNAAVQALNGSGKVSIPRKRTAAYLLKSTVHLGTSTAVDSSVVLDFEPGTLVFSTLPGVANVVFDIKNVPGHFNNQGIKNLHLQCTNSNGTAIKMNGQCFGSFENCYFELFNCGIYFSNEGNNVFNEFVRFNGIELHLCKTAILMAQDGGTDTSAHGISFRNTTINVGAGQVGLQVIDACWYNADFDLKFFSQAASEAIIKMSTSAPTANKGVFGSGSLTCEGDATMVGTGRFYLHGDANFMSGVIDNLSSPDAWEQGFIAYNYVKPRIFGTSGLSTAEIKPKSSQFASTGPDGSFARLTGPNVQALLANSFAAHAVSPGNGFYTAYTGYQQNYDAGKFGWFLASDGSEMKSFAPNGTNCLFRAGANGSPYSDNIAFGIKDGKFLIGGNSQLLAGSGSPNGVIPGNNGDVYLDRSTGDAYRKTGGAGNTSWVTM